MVVAWIATLLDVLLFLASFGTISWRAWAEARLDAGCMEQVMREGVEVTIDGEAVLEQRYGTWTSSTAFALVVGGGARVEVPAGTGIMLSTHVGVLPGGTRLRALFHTEAQPDEGPLRTSGRREAGGVILLAHVDPALRARRAEGPSWFAAGVVVTFAAATALFAGVLGWFATVVSVGGALVLAWDLARNDRGLVGWLVARGDPGEIEPVVRGGRQITAGLGLATAGTSLAVLAWLLPQLSPWTLRHAAVAPLDRVEPALDGRIVAVTGPLVSDEHADDPELLAAGDELVLERVVQRERLEERGGRFRGKAWGWHADEIAGLGSRRGQVQRVRIGAYDLDLAGVALPPAVELPIDARRLRAGDWLGTLGWDRDRHGYFDDHARITFRGLASGTRVTIVAVQHGRHLVPIASSSDGTKGVSVVLGEAPHGESVLDPWPSDGRVLACEWLVLFGMLVAFARVRDTLIALAVALAILAFGALAGSVGDAAAAAMALVPFGFALLTFPRSILVAVGVALALAVPIAAVRATGTASLGYAGAALTVLALAVFRIAYGWHRSISLDFDS